MSSQMSKLCTGGSSPSRGMHLEILSEGCILYRGKSQSCRVEEICRTLCRCSFTQHSLKAKYFRLHLPMHEKNYTKSCLLIDWHIIYDAFQAFLRDLNGRWNYADSLRWDAQQIVKNFHEWMLLMESIFTDGVVLGAVNPHGAIEDVISLSNIYKRSPSFHA